MFRDIKTSVKEGVIDISHFWEYQQYFSIMEVYFPVPFLCTMCSPLDLVATFQVHAMLLE